MKDAIYRDNWTTLEAVKYNYYLIEVVNKQWTINSHVLLHVYLLLRNNQSKRVSIITPEIILIWGV